jgi:hypothetical protein
MHPRFYVYRYNDTEANIIYSPVFILQLYLIYNLESLNHVKQPSHQEL